MTPSRFQRLRDKYAKLRVVLAGDFCLDRYLEIDPSRRETSIETGLRVHNVVRVRSQPGGAGTILNNLVALGVGEILPIGFAGLDGEGFELRRALRAQRGVRLDYFLSTPHRRTFTYTKPLVVSPGKPPQELNRLDLKNWTPTPARVQDQLIGALLEAAKNSHAIIILDQVEVAETGVVSAQLLKAVKALARSRPQLLVLADSRRGLRGYPSVGLKMNRAEFAVLTGSSAKSSVRELKSGAAALARQQGRPVFITLAEVGIIGASPTGEVLCVPALPVRGPIDIVGAGDAVMANLAAALAAGASLREALHLAVAAASVVIHQLGTTGTASLEQIQPLLGIRRPRGAAGH